MAVSYGRYRYKILDSPISSVLFYDRLHVCLASKVARIYPYLCPSLATWFLSLRFSCGVASKLATLLKYEAFYEASMFKANA